MTKLYKIEVYVPETHLDNLKEAIFDAGAGKIGNYDSCCWETAGTGQYRPLDSSDPFLGCIGELEEVREIKVETVCSVKNLDSVVEAINRTHPYETPAYQYWNVNERSGFSNSEFSYMDNMGSERKEKTD